MRDEDTGELWCPTALPIRDERRPTSRATARATAGSSTTAHGIALELLQFVPLDDPIKISRLTLRNARAASAQPVRDRLCRMGARPVARASRAVHRDRDRRRRPARCSRAIPGTQRLRDARRLRRSGRTADATGPATAREFLGRNGTLGSPAALLAGAAVRATWAPGSIPAPRCRRRSSSQPGGASRSSSSSARPRSRDEAQRADRALPRRRSRRGACRGRRALGRAARRRPGQDAGPGDGHHAQRLAALSDARLPHLGALGASTRRAAPTASATSCRTAWRCRVARAGDDARSICCARRRGSSSKATCSTGGCRSPGQGVRTRISDDRVVARLTPSPTMSRSTGDARSSTRRALPRRPAADAGRARRLLPARRSPTRRHAVRALRARRSTAASPIGAHGLPLMGTGDWNDGMNRVGEGARARASGSAGSCYATLDRLRPARRGTRRHGARARRWRAHAAALRAALEREAWDGDWYRRGLVRRRHAARLGGERRVPDRFDRAVLGGDLRRGRSASAPRARWRRSTNI